jgi:hypothetical protein
MKLANFVSCVALALLLTAPWLQTQSNGQDSPKILANVPFDFMIGRTMFPAGRYTIKPLKNRGFYLQAARGRASLRIAAKPLHASLPSSATRLVFEQENRHYQLRELWMNAASGAMIPGPQPSEQPRNVRESRVEVPATCIGCN